MVIFSAVALFVFRTENYEYLTPRLNRYVFQAGGKAGSDTTDPAQEAYTKQFLSTDS